MIPFLLAATALVVVIVGVLTITQVLRFEQLGAAIWRILVFLWAVIVACVLLRWVLLPILICALVWLNNVMLWVLVSIFTATTLLFLLRLLRSSFANRNDKREKE